MQLTFLCYKYISFEETETQKVNNLFNKKDFYTFFSNLISRCGKYMYLMYNFLKGNTDNAISVWEKQTSLTVLTDLFIL